MKKPAAGATKKPVRRATLLEDLLSDFLEIEDILLKMELKGLKPLTAKELQLYRQLRAKLHDVISELANDLAQEQSAA